MSTQPVERARRPSAEVRDLMLTAARELFLAKGYEAATTKEIALRAGVSERLLFTNFGAKGALFREAMIPPFAAFTDSYVQAWQDGPADTTVEDRIAGFVGGLLDIVEQNRVVLISALYHSQSSTGPESELLEDLARTFQRIHQLVEASADWDFDPGPVFAASAGAVMSYVLLDQLVFPRAKGRPSRDAQLKALTDFVLYGIAPLFNPPLTPPKRRR